MTAATPNPPAGAPAAPAEAAAARATGPATAAGRGGAIRRDSRIYLAGHTGLVGGAILRGLQSRGYERVITRTHDELDLTDQGQTRTFFAQESPDVVIVAAARVGGILANWEYPYEFVADNLAIELNTIGEAFRAGVKRLVFLGSSCIYPKLAPQPLKEEYLLTGPLEETNRAYAIAKIAGIELCRSLNREYGTDYLSLMPTNLYGPGDNFDLETSHLLPALIRKFHEAARATSAARGGSAAGGGSTAGGGGSTAGGGGVAGTGAGDHAAASGSDVSSRHLQSLSDLTYGAPSMSDLTNAVVSGESSARGASAAPAGDSTPGGPPAPGGAPADGPGGPPAPAPGGAHAAAPPAVVLWGTGTPRREMLYVDDLAAAVCLMLEAGNWRDVPDGLLNVGSGKDSTIAELAATVAEVVGYDGPVHWDTSKPDGTPQKLMDITRIRNLGWQPITGLRDGIARTYEWFLANRA
jgi:nucleoside-diphosphate-sugar epimerase